MSLRKWRAREVVLRFNTAPVSLLNMCEASFVNIATATSALGPCTGVTVDVSQSDLDLVRGGGAAGRRGLRLGSVVYLIGW